jgi:hypothetical protein
MDETGKSRLEPRGMTMADLIVLVAGVACALSVNSVWPCVQMTALEDNVPSPWPFEWFERPFRALVLTGLALSFPIACRLLARRRPPALGEWLAIAMGAHPVLWAGRWTGRPPAADTLAYTLDAWMPLRAFEWSLPGWMQAGPQTQGKTWLSVLGLLGLLLSAPAVWTAVRRRTGRLVGVWAVLASWAFLWSVAPAAEDAIRQVTSHLWSAPPWGGLRETPADLDAFFAAKARRDALHEAAASLPIAVFFVIPATWAFVRMVRRLRGPRTWTDRVGAFAFLVSGGCWIVMQQADNGWWYYLNARGLSLFAIRWGPGALVGLVIASTVPALRVLRRGEQGPGFDPPHRDRGVTPPHLPPAERMTVGPKAGRVQSHHRAACDRALPLNSEPL